MRSAIAKMCGGSDPIGRLRYRLIWGLGGDGWVVGGVWQCTTSPVAGIVRG